MELAESKITSKGQISLPTAVRRKLGLVPGTRIEWLEHDGEIVVRRASRYSSQDIHDAVFSTAAKPASASAPTMDNGIRRYIKKKHARG
jgi:AbrB family looped-hinge helix DNA binding protein